MAQRAWSEAEVALLLYWFTVMVCLAMWNTEAGTFHPYYLNYLKGIMTVEFSQAGIGEIMHIEGKIKRWKRTCYLM